MLDADDDDEGTFMKFALIAALALSSTAALAGSWNVNCSNSRGTVQISRFDLSIEGKSLELGTNVLGEDSGAGKSAIDVVLNGDAKELENDEYTSSDCRQHIRKRYAVNASLVSREKGETLLTDQLICEERVITSTGGGQNCTPSGDEAAAEF